MCIMMTVLFFLLLRGIDFSNRYAIRMGLATIEMKPNSIWLGPTDKAQVIFQLVSRNHCSRYKQLHFRYEDVTSGNNVISIIIVYFWSIVQTYWYLTLTYSTISIYLGRINRHCLVRGACGIETKPRSKILSKKFPLFPTILWPSKKLLEWKPRTKSIFERVGWNVN